MKNGIIKIADGSKISYRVIGDLSKPVILFVSGSIFNYQQFDVVLLPSLKKYLKDEYCYVNYDYVGIAESSPLQGDFEFLEIARQHLEFMDALGIDQAHHYGYSKGSIISNLVAAKSKERVSSIGSYGSPNLGYNEDPTTKKEFSKRLQYLNSITGIWDKLIDEQNFKLVYDSVFLPLIFKGKQSSTLGFFDKIKNWWVKGKLRPMLVGTLIHNIVKLYELYKRDISEEDRQKYIEAMKKIDIPVLLQHGLLDEVVPIKGAEILSQYFTNSEMKKYPKFTHSSPVLMKKQGSQLMKDYSIFIRKL